MIENIENMCQHLRRIGDNYGLTCQDCGEVLEGYGYYAEGSKTCKHRFLPEYPKSENKVCVYCEETRRKEE